MGLNGLLGFKGLTHLMPTQTHPFDTSTYIQEIFVKHIIAVWRKQICQTEVGTVDYLTLFKGKNHS